jgi:hypothetical protein
VELLDPAGAALTSAKLTSAGTFELRATARQDGWQTFKSTAAGLPPDSGAAFELIVTYTATREFSPA